ncbi:MAG: T9SS type A sorting domain-containing protein [Flavobacteriales bacterium]
MTVWRDSLYICGGFNIIEGDTIIQVAQWIGGDATTNCSTPTGIAQHGSRSVFSVAPNPATTSITLQGLPTAAATFVVHDALGRVVMRTQARPPAMDIAGLPSGTYVVRILDAQNLSLGTARFVKQ